MPDITWPDEFFPRLMWPSIVPLEVDSVLDVGCGRGMLGCLMKVYREPKRIVGLDAFKPYLDFVKNLGVYDEVLERDLTILPLPFKDKEFDVAICLEVIEHLKKEQGLKVLDELERVGKRVIVSTPGKFYSQPEYDGNVKQAHLSFYSPGELEARGYKVFGVGSLKCFGARLPTVSGALGRMAFRFPRLSSVILAVKH